MIKRFVEATWSAVKPPQPLLNDLCQVSTLRDCALMLIAAIAIMAVVIGRMP